jgi:hypothetical protein
MVKSFKHILLTSLVFFLGYSVQAQVKFKLSLLSDQQTYLVSMAPEVSWPTPMNIVGSAQIVLKMPSDQPFLAGNINSLLPGVTWADNAYVESPKAAPDYNFICFALNEMGTRNFQFEAGVETPLFTFTNLEPERARSIELVENEDPMVKEVIRIDRLNITQNLTVLGAGGNAYTGIIKDDLTVVRTIGEPLILTDLRAYPIPAVDELQVTWTSLPDQEVRRLVVTDLLGREIVMQRISEETGAQQIRLDVSAYPTGLYQASLMTGSGERTTFKFIVTRF